MLAALPHPAALVEWSDGRGWFRQWNDRFERSFFALTRSNRLTDPADSSRIQVEMARFVLSGHDVSRFEIERMTPLGMEVFDCTLAWVRDAGPCEERILISAIDRTADRRVEASLRRELISDSLTALPNRIGFGEFVEAALDRCSREAGGGDATVGVLIIDLLRFSRINEALGTMAGDELILAVASRLKACVGNDVLLGRLGGNDFGICEILTDGAEALMLLAERIKAAFEAPVRLSNLEIAVECAIGCSLMPVADVEPDQLIRQAKTAARVAKTSGRLEIYRAGELGEARQRFFLESHLRDSLHHGRLHLQFQPIIHLSTAQVTGFEALARWTHPILGAIPPTDFIPVAEESGLIIQLGRWALQEAVEQLRHWDEQLGGRIPVRMNVNLSPIQMARDDVLKMIGDTLGDTGMDGGRLTIELTESALVTDPANCAFVLDALKRSDIAIAMDDFGTGYSNMASLQGLPIDMLKIDRSFVSDMMVDNDKQEIVRAILSLADALGMKATAEGIEDSQVAEKLRDMGCTYGQGYYFAKPMSADEAFAYWQDRSNSATH
ncbi:MAG: putative bifunctional diguanylate cyclase/phosphodiesterase [Sphingobium sp.]